MPAADHVPAEPPSDPRLIPAPFSVTEVLRRLAHLVSRRGRLTPPPEHAVRPKSIAIRHLDAGSSGDAEVEIAALSGPRSLRRDKMK
jgi:hypothetical protein